MNFDEFVNKYLNKAIDYDGVAGVQCVDLVKRYLKDVFGISAGSWGDAHCYYDNFAKHKELTANFTRLANTPTFVPQKGDICVWKSSLSKGGWGHIAIATGEGDISYFYSYDQNWTGNHDPMKKVKHNYNHFAGVLRPKDQSKIKTVKPTAAAMFETGKNYKLTANIKVRTGAGTQYRQKRYGELTADGQKHAYGQEQAVLKIGTIVTLQEVKIIDGNFWGRTPSGWIALRYDGSNYAVKA